MKRERPTFEHACRVYVHRYTAEHIPAWAQGPMRGLTGTDPDKVWYYAPQYASDREWYERTLFPGEAGHVGRITECFSMNATWPLGCRLSEPYKVGK